MNVRTATDWRAFWRERGERELSAVLEETWPPAREGDATRIATLLGSRASTTALAAELTRMRDERAEAPDAEQDASAAAAVANWFGGA